MLKQIFLLFLTNELWNYGKTVVMKKVVLDPSGVTKLYCGQNDISRQSITWYKDGRVLNGNNTEKLEIHGMSYNIAGMYKCVYNPEKHFISNISTLTYCKLFSNKTKPILIISIFKTNED